MLGFGLAASCAESFSESLEYIMYIDDEILEFLAIERYWTIYSRRCSQSGDPHPILACEQLSLVDAPLTLNHDTNLFPIID